MRYDNQNMGGRGHVVPVRDYATLGGVVMEGGFRRGYAKEAALRASLSERAFDDAYYGGVEIGLGRIVALHRRSRTLY